MLGVRLGLLSRTTAYGAIRGSLRAAYVDYATTRSREAVELQLGRDGFSWNLWRISYRYARSSHHVLLKVVLIIHCAEPTSESCPIPGCTKRKISKSRQKPR